MLETFQSIEKINLAVELFDHGKSKNKSSSNQHKNMIQWAVVVAQLVERSLSILGIRSSNPVIGNFIYFQLYLQTELKQRR